MARSALGTIAAALALLLLAGEARAATIAVESDEDPAPAGLCGLRDAIVAANTDAPAGDCPAGSGDDVVDLTGVEGQMLVGGALPPTELPALTSAITVRGPGADRLVLAANGVRLFVVDTFAGVVIEGLTLQDGDAGTAAFGPGFGGCVYAWGPVTIRDSRLTGCGGRGALYVMAGLARVERSLFDFNRGEAMSVGGIAGAGGIVVENTTVAGNDWYGLELVNADGPGPSAWVYASTFVDNGGANLYVPTYSGDPNEFPLRLDHVLLASGEPNANCAGQPVISLGHNLANDDTCALDQPDDLPSTPPSIGPLADNGGPTATFAPFSYSDAVDTGASACPGSAGELTTDQRGRPRPRDGDGDGDARCDRGAFEVPEPAAGAALAAALALAGLSRRGRRGSAARAPRCCSASSSSRSAPT